MDQKEIVAKKAELSKLNLKISIASIALAYAVIAFICGIVGYYESGVAYSIFGGRGIFDDANLTMLIVNHIINLAIASLLVGVWGAKREALLKEIEKVSTIVLEANTIPCPKCNTGIERTTTGKVLKCPGCGAEYKNPFYKE